MSIGSTKTMITIDILSYLRAAWSIALMLSGHVYSMYERVHILRCHLECSH